MRGKANGIINVIGLFLAWMGGRSKLPTPVTHLSCKIYASNKYLFDSGKLLEAIEPSSAE
jgi:hypothetical protein